MKIPKQVKIAGHNYRVIYPYKFKKDQWAAEIDHDRHEIKIASHSSLSTKKVHSEIEESLLHEVLHAVNCRYLPVKQRLHEAQIQQISQGMYQVLKDNKIKF